MLEKVLQSILRRYFGEFITGLENVALAFWTGKINIQNASFKHTKINELLKMHNIPLNISYSYIGSLQLDIPWNKLSSAPVNIKLTDVYLVFTLEQFVQTMMPEALNENSKYLLIKNYVQHILTKQEEMRGEGQKQSGFLKKLLIKILHNVNLQISNIHIRIQTHKNKGRIEQDEVYYSCIGDDNRPTDFSLGFCIESIQADTINEKNQKEYVHIENDKTPIRKNINLNQISFYWEEQSASNVTSLPQDKKIQAMKGIISRQQSRLLTLDGSLLMEKNKDKLDYYFSTSFRVLQIRTNYQQLKQIIQVTQAFINARKKKKLVKQKEIKHENQLKLRDQFNEMFKELYINKFDNVTEQCIKLIQCVDRKLLMKWTRSETIELLKRSKLKLAEQNKNRRTWLGFLSKNAAITLTEEQIREIQRQIESFVEMIENSSNISVGLYLFIRSIHIVMDHAKKKQKMYFIADEIQLNLQKQEKTLKVDLRVYDIGLTYKDVKNWTQVSIFKKNCFGEHRIMKLEVTNTPHQQKLQFESEAMSITHEIQFLSFISEMINLQQKEEVKANVVFINSEPITKPRPNSVVQPEVTSPDSKINKVYNYNIRMKKMEMKIELDSSTFIHAYLEGITVQQNRKTVNHHWASFTNMGVSYINIKDQNKSYNIIEDINIGVDLTGLKMLKSQIPKIRVVLNEESLYSIVSCLKQQYKLLKIQKKQYKNELSEDEEKYMEGQVQIMSLFKSRKIYQAVLVQDRLIFFEKGQDGKVDYTQTSKQIMLNTLSVSRCDENSFKLESVTIDEILHCKSTIQTDRWIYHIEQRILETSSKQKIFQMLDKRQQNQSQSQQMPHIYIPYDSTIDVKLNLFEVIYEKNNIEKILSLKLANLNLILKENNIQFERRIHIEELLIKNLIVKDDRDEYNTLVSNLLNYFEDPDADSEPEEPQPNISFVIEGKKKTHPKYTGEITIKGKLNRLFVNYNAQFVFQILYRLVYGNQKAKAYPQTLRNAKIIEFLKEILEERLDIPRKYEKAQNFQYSPAYFKIDQYQLLHPSLVLFHFQVQIEEAEIYIVNGLNNIWMHKIIVDKPELHIDKSTDFIFIKGQCHGLTLSDITGYPNTVVTPFTQQSPYTLVSVKAHPNKPAVTCNVGLFPPCYFINKQHFKNYFSMEFQNLHINYQQQPALRFIDFLTNQIILFIMEPFSLHKFDTPDRGSYVFGHLNFTEKQVKKILYESIYPTYTHLRIQAHQLQANLNTHPHLDAIPVKIANAKFFSAPYINNHRVHVRLDQLSKFQKQYKTLEEIRLDSDCFQNRVSKFQWVTRYLITVTNLSSPIFQNEFNHEMYFERANNGDKDLLLPFLVINKELQMQGKIKHLSAVADKKTYDLINKCFMYNISFDDKKDSYFVTNHKFQAISNPSKLYYSLKLGELAFLIPDIHRTVVVIPECQYKFIREINMEKVMEINGKGLHVFGNNQKYNLFRPINFNQKRGLQYKITMMTNGDKNMVATLNNVDFQYQQTYFMDLLRYFLLSQDCFPKQQIYEDIPLITCQVQLKNSFYRIAENNQYVYALKGDIQVIWTRPKNTHPQIYKANKQLYPLNTQAQIYDATLKGVSLRKYNKKMYANKQKNYRALSLPMQVKVRIANIMKRQGDIFYQDMVGNYSLDFVCLKLCYKDVIDLQTCFGGGDKEEEKKMEEKVPESPQLNKKTSKQNNKRSMDRKPTQYQIQGYTSHAKHSFNINKLSLQIGLSQLPVPLLNFTLINSQTKLQLIGFTKIITNILHPTLQYWNMLIGRWEPIIQKSTIDELTLRLGNETYCSLGSSKPLLMNFSTQAIKVLKLVSKDISQKGQMKILSRKGMIQGMHVSPYALTNRTGHSILLQNSHSGDFTQVSSNKLKPNETTHVYNKTPDLETTIDTIRYQIQGDPTEYQVNFNQVESEKKVVTYQNRTHSLWLEVISSPILKEIVISSPYVIYNRTSFTMVLKVADVQFEVQADKKMAIPFTMQIKADSIFGITFSHLVESKPCYSFTLLDIEQGYEHSITYGDSHSFVTLIHLRKSNQQLITVSPLTTFVNLLPLNLKLEAVYTKPNHEKEVLEEELEVSKEKNLYQFGSKSKVTMRVKFTGFNYSAFHDVAYNQQNSEGKMTFIDHRGLETYVLTKTITKNKRKIIYLYLETVMINETKYPLYLYSQGQLLAGQRIRGIAESQSKYTIINQAKQISLGFKEDDYSSNAKINRQQLGNQFLQVPNNDKLVQLVLNSSVHCVDEKLQLFTKIMKITPRFIVKNKCTRDLCLRQVNTEQRYYLKVGELSDWVWHSKDDTRQLTITAADNDIGLRDGWDFSAPIQPQTLEQTVIVLRPNSRSEHRLLIKLQVFKQTQYTYIIFKELTNPEDSLITFKNTMSFAHLRIHQSFLQNISPPWNMYKDFSCRPNQQTLFGWDYPGEDHQVVIQFTFLDQYQNTFQCDEVLIDLDKVNKPKIYEFKGVQGEILQIEVSVQYIGIHKKIIFQSMDESSTSRLYEEQLQFQLTKTKIGISLSEIGISLIAGHPRCQILFTSIKKLGLIIEEKQFKRNYELKIKYINIDNNFHHNTIFPVLFTPLKQRKTIEKPRPFLIVLVEQNLKSTQIMQINYFRMAIQPISFKLYDEIVTKIYDMRQELNEPEQQTTMDLYNTYRSYATQLEWKEKEFAARDKSIFIREIQIGRLTVELSFSIKPTSGGNIVIYTIVTLFRTALSNVSESQIKLSRFYRKNINMPDLTNQMGEFYRKQLFKQIYKIPTSINILGNPYVLVNYLAEGVWEVINQPSEGFIKGPIQGAIGVVKGGVYFTRNVVAGISNSFQVISQSCSHGISYVTFDEKFITRRDKIQMQKSKHLWQGTKSAVFALYTGFQVAVTGLYRHPKQNLQKSGAPGFFKGMLIGVAGLVTKPLSGMFEGISKFSQGVKNTALFFQDGPNSTRSRPPRVFIGQQEYFTEYNLQESKAINLLQFHSTKYLNSVVMLVSVDVNPYRNQTVYIVLTDVFLVQLSKSSKKIISEIRVEDISEVFIPKPNEIKLVVGQQPLILYTHKFKELYECFRVVFDLLERNTNSDGEMIQMI